MHCGLGVGVFSPLQERALRLDSDSTGGLGALTYSGQADAEPCQYILEGKKKRFLVWDVAQWQNPGLAKVRSESHP